MRSRPLQPSCSGAEPETPAATSSPDASGIAAAAHFLADRAIFGLVWLDEKLSAVGRFGSIVDFVPEGRPVTDTILPLLGLDSQIRALRRTPQRSLDIPNVSINLGDSQGPRININVFWSVAERRYLVLVSRVLDRSDLELELAKQVRARSIAESEAAAKAEALVKVNAELERANRELEEFAYVISHDLKAPLRGVRYFIGDLEASLEKADHDEARLCLGRVQAQVRRMSNMLNALLEYARVGRKAEMLETVALAGLAEEIIGSVGAPPGMSLTLDGDWPTIVTLRAPLDLVLRNLVENAVKHHDRPTGRITVRAVDIGAVVSLSVEDDGPGIPPNWHEAIFLPFRKIEDDEAIEGSGIGLALVKKTVELVGGTISVASSPDIARGTIFRVAWPKVIRV
ncbi:MAG TPA: HAMP domain-containing sensor histidine kinase [Hyphomicrobiaceae bacterium]|nr:HAMP domain-containing sensor histidine kinase [Hyphomicrobiaceae bacterium]